MDAAPRARRPLHHPARRPDDQTMNGPLSSHLTSRPLTPDLVHGALMLEPGPRGMQLHRVPAWARAQNWDGQLTMTEAQPAGVRVVLRSDGTVLELNALRTTVAYRSAPPRPDGAYDLLVDGVLTRQSSMDGGDVLTLDIGAASPEHLPGPVGTVRFEGLPPGEKTVQVWLPHNELTMLSRFAPMLRCRLSSSHGVGGCTTAAPSARAPTRPAPRRRGPLAQRPSMASRWSTSIRRRRAAGPLHRQSHARHAR